MPRGYTSPEAQISKLCTLLDCDTVSLCLKASCLGITPTQYFCLDRASRGYLQQHVAEELNVQVGTVKNRNREMLIRMGADTIAHAVAIGFRKGYLS